MNDSFEYVHKLEENIRKSLMEKIENKEIIALYNDPGKSNICTLGIGGKGNAILKYTKSLRKHEIDENRNKRERDNITSKKSDISIISEKTNTIKSLSSYRELSESIISSGKSCILSTFMNYLKERKNVSIQLSMLYEKKVFRRMEYRSFIGRRSSEDKLISNIRKKFEDKDEKKKEIVIFWGNWGRNPNLKNQPPSPGIGLRRKVERYYKTYTVDERGTSSRCNECLSTVSNELVRNVRREDKLTGEMINMSEHVHHVLRCQNENCRIWWDRDVLGMNNIKKQALHSLTFGTLSETFTKVRKNAKIKTKTKKKDKKDKSSIKQPKINLRVKQPRKAIELHKSGVSRRRPLVVEVVSP